MSKTFPLHVKRSGRRGPKARAGERYPSGDLKPRAPNALLLKRRREIAADPAMAENPLDAAFSNGWLTEEQHRSGRAYALLYRRSAIQNPGIRAVALGESPDEVSVELRGRRIRDMNDAEIDTLWDIVFNETAGRSEDERERQTAASMAKWRTINEQIEPSARAELFSVCVLESWPQWFCHRLNGLAIERQAESEKRAMTDDEMKLRAKRFASAWERKRTLLIDGLAVVSKVLREHAPKAGANPRRDRPLVAPIGNRLVEAVHYVDEAGEPVLIVEKRGRR